MTPDEATLALLAAGLHPNQIAPLSLEDTVIFLNTYTDTEELARWRQSIIGGAPIGMDSPLDRNATLCHLVLCDLRQHELDSQEDP